MKETQIFCVEDELAPVGHWGRLKVRETVVFSPPAACPQILALERCHDYHLVTQMFVRLAFLRRNLRWHDYRKYRKLNSL